MIFLSCDKEEGKFSYQENKTPGWCGSVDWVPDYKSKCRLFDSQSGHRPGLPAGSPVGGVQEATTHWCFSLPFSLPSPLSKNKENRRKRKQNTWLVALKFWSLAPTPEGKNSPVFTWKHNFAYNARILTPSFEIQIAISDSLPSNADKWCCYFVPLCPS